MNVITYFNSGFLFISVFDYIFAKMPEYQTEESIKSFKKSYTFSFLCAIYKMSTITEDYLPAITAGSMALGGLSIHEYGEISKKRDANLLCSAVFRRYFLANEKINA